MTTSIEQLLRTAAQRGLLPADAAPPAQETRPWPVVLLIALGAWLAALPLLGVAGLLLGGLVGQGMGTYFVGVLLLAGATLLLRARELPTFVEQLAMPALLVGGGTLGMGLFRDLPDAVAAGVLCAIALGVAALIARPWLRVLLGAAACGLFIGAVVPAESALRRGGLDSVWVALHLALAARLAVLWLQERSWASGARARLAALAEAAGAGWVLAVLAGLAVQSGLTMFLAGSLGLFAGLAGGGTSPLVAGMQAVSFALAAGAVVLAGRRWPSLRQPPAALAGMVLAALAFFLPALGGVLLVLAWTATSQRWRLTGAAALAAAWIIGAFYYQLAWPLAIKAMVLTVTGAALAATAWWAHRAPAARATMRQPFGRAAVLVLATALLAPAAASFSIWQKERLIAEGSKVYVALAPVDPRSLMQGDFMRLEFSVPASGALPPLTGAERPCAVARRDARGVAQLLRTARGNEPLAADEFRIELTPKDGRWMLVTDAWFFREGEAARFERARFGEFRVLPDGRALLVGLADAELRPLQP